MDVEDAGAPSPAKVSVLSVLCVCACVRVCVCACVFVCVCLCMFCGVLPH